MIPPLLQADYQFLARPDTRALWIFGLVVVGFLFLLIFGSMMSRRRQASLSPDQKQRYNRAVFARMARDIGLQKNHVEVLDYLIKACKVMQPFLVFSNPGLLDDILRKGLYSLQNNRDISEEERESRLALIFQIKQIIERNSRRGVGIRATNLLKAGQALVLFPESGGQFASRLISNMKDMLACEAPRDASGQSLRWPKGTRLKASFWRESDAGYVFPSKVLGFETVKGTGCILIQHSKTLRKEQRRKHRRRPLERPCFFYPVQIIEAGQGRKSKPRAVVQANRQNLGTILDISAGGCSISSLSPLPVGTLVKVEFEMNRGNPVVVFGKVRRFRDQKRRGGVMHVMFTKVSGTHLNRIYSYVYNYTSPTTTQRPSAPASPLRYR